MAAATTAVEVTSFHQHKDLNTDDIISKNDELERDAIGPLDVCL